MASIYDNAPLAFGTNTNIRLIELLSGPVTCGGQQPEIRCKFHILPLTQNVIYTAISYMWGQDDTTVDIELDGARFAVRPNLFELLRTLSRSESCPDLLWVDAMCINQKNESERTHQVRLMGQIYSQATGVIVWLGHGDPEYSLAMEHLRTTSWMDNHLQGVANLERYFRHLYDLPVPSETMLNMAYGADMSHASAHYTADRDGQSGQLIADYFLGIDIARQLLAICTHPYWSRVWIVQEIFLAKSVCIQYADSRLDNIDQLCSRIQSISTLMKPAEQFHERSAYKHLNAILESPAARLLAKRRMWRTPENRRFVIPWDSGFGTLGCADVRDRVYAMSALMDPKLAIVPDYSKSASQLFESIFEEHLQRNSTFSGPIWNLQSMFELDDKDPVIQRAKQHGSPEWLSTGTLAAYGRTMAINDIDKSSSASRAYQGSDDDALARMRAEWSEQTRRRRAAKERSARALKSSQ